MRPFPTSIPGAARWVTLSNRYGALVLALCVFASVLNRIGQLLELIQRGPRSFALGRMLQSHVIEQIRDPSVVDSIDLLQHTVDAALVPYALVVALSLIAYAYWFGTLIRLAVGRLQGDVPRIRLWSSPRLAFLAVLIVAIAKLWVDRAMVVAVANNPLALKTLSQLTSIDVGQFQGPDALGAGGLVVGGVVVLGVYIGLSRLIGRWANRRGLI